AELPAIEPAAEGAAGHGVRGKKQDADCHRRGTFRRAPARPNPYPPAVRVIRHGTTYVKSTAHLDRRKCFAILSLFEASRLARLNGVQEVAGSNPVAPTR